MPGPRLSEEERADILIDALLPALPGGMAELGIRSGACILATRLTLDIAAAVDVHARPVATAVIAFNETYWRIVQTENRQGTMEEGAYSVGVEGTGAMTDTGWDGHLIVAIGRGRWLFDATTAQFSRPQYAIDAPPALALRLPEDRTRGEDEWWQAPLPSGGVITYRPIRSRGYAAAPDWRKNKTARRQIAAPIVEVVRDAFERETRTTARLN